MHKHISKILNLNPLTINEIEEICLKAIEILILDPNIPNVSTPVSVCGDIHGQLFDLIGLLKIDGTPKHRKYIFLGNYVNGNENSLDCFLLLLCYKIMYPHNIFLIRGNNEQQDINKTYNFYNLLINKYGSKIWRLICDVFTYLYLGCLIDGRVLCVHAGISPKTLSLNHFKRINRFDCLNLENELEDLTCSDPFDGTGFSAMDRASGYFYGSDVTNIFLECNDLSSIISSHQIVFEGYKFHFPDKNVATVWGAPNFINKFRNPGSFIRVESDLIINDQRLCIYCDSPQTTEMLNSVYDLYLM